MNDASGALPDDHLLLIERMTIASLFPLSLILLYLIGINLDGRLMGVMAVLYFGLNPLILLHTRRAMAEGVLIFGLMLALFAFIKADKYPLLVGLAVAVAFNGKHSAAVLVPIGLIAVCWRTNSQVGIFSNLISQVIKYVLGLILLTVMLNPFLWRNPISAIQEALNQRQDLLARQLADVQRLSPAQVLETPIERSAVVLTQILFAPPIFSEVGNYRAETTLAEEEYINIPGNQVWRNYLSGGVILGFALLGLIAALRKAIHEEAKQRRNTILFLLSFLVMVTGIVTMIPLAWQRYSVPLVPFTSIIASMGLVWGIKNSRRMLTHGSLSSQLSQILSQFTPDSWMP
jgi:4-amino-4-deoxy-L-arabinose transferase-like glycosyltransferase